MTDFIAPTNETDIAVCIEEIENGIFGATVFMHHREIMDAQRAVNKFLGVDTLADQRQAEYDALPQHEKDRMTRAKDFGIYGVFHLATRDEVPLALSVVAKELSAAFRINAVDRGKLQNPEEAEKVTRRFPAITAERIALALNA